MGLFNHLFKPRHNEAGEKAVEDNPSPAEGGKPAPPPDPTAFLQPKEFTHRRPTPPPATTRIAPPLRPAERKGPPTEAPREIVLTLGDILSHVPTQFLKTGMHDSTRELHFATGELTSDIARGRPTVPLSRIAAQCPEVFHSDIGPDDDMQIRLPLQKLLDQLGLYTPPARVSVPAVETTAEPVPATGEKSEAGEQLIHLSLTAILARCPGGLFIGERPRVDETERISLPFAPIERQLIGGRVEISSLRFVALLPPALAPHFAVREGVNIPIPLEEIFRNLPGGSTPAPAIEPAPAGHEVKAEPPVVTEPKAETPAPAPLERKEESKQPAAPPREEPSPATGPSSSSFRTPVRPPPMLGPAQAEPAAVEERPAEEIAAATAPVEVSHVTAPISPVEPPAPVIEAPDPAPLAAAPSVTVQPPPAFRPRVVLPPPVFASAQAEPPRDTPSLVPPPFVFTAPPMQAAEPEAAPTDAGVPPSPPPAAAPAPARVAGHLDQDALQGLFMTDEALDLPKLARLAAGLPGVEACVITVRGDAVQYGHLPIEADALAEMAPRFADVRALGPVACVTVNAAQHSVSYFTRGELCVCAIHGPRGFLPGVREKLAALADAIAGI